MNSCNGDSICSICSTWLSDQMDSTCRCNECYSIKIGVVMITVSNPGQSCPRCSSERGDYMYCTLLGRLCGPWPSLPSIFPPSCPSPPIILPCSSILSPSIVPLAFPYPSLSLCVHFSFSLLQALDAIPISLLTLPGSR